MAIIYSYPSATPTSNDLLLGTDVDAQGKPTKNYTIKSIIDLIASGATGLGAVLSINNSAKNSNGVNQPINDLTFIKGTSSATFASFLTIGGASINGTIGTGFTSISSTGATGFTGNLLGVINGGSSLAGTSGPGSTDAENVLGVTQVFTDSSTRIATTAFVQSVATVADLDFRGDATGVIGSVDLDLQTFDIVGTALNIETSTTAGGQVLTLKLTDDVTIADDLTVTDVLTVSGTGASSTIAGGLQVNNSGGAHAFRVKGQTNDNLIATNYGATDAEDQVAIGKNVADNGTRLDVSGLTQSTTITSTNLLTAGNVKNEGYYEDSNSSSGSNGQVLTSSNVGAGPKTLWVDDPNPTPYEWIVASDFDTGTPPTANTPYTVANGDAIDFVGVGNIQTEWDLTSQEVRISAVGDSVTGTGVANQVTYWTGAQTINGDAGMTYDATANNLTVAAVIKAGTFTTTAGASAWTTTVLNGFTSITSISTISSPNTLAGFIGDAGASLVPTTTPATTINNVQFQGNASTANSLKLSGTVSMSGDTVAAGVTYTHGGPVPLVSTISDSVVYNKTLAGFNATTGAVQNGDSIIEALERLQGQITTLPQGIVYQGIWKAGTVSNTSAAISGTTITLASAPDETLVTGMIVTAVGISGTSITISSVTSQTEVVVSGTVNIGSGIPVTFSRAGGYPDLTVAGKKVNGHYYIVSVAGNATPNSPTSSIPNEWDVRDWCVFADDGAGGGVDEWQKIDNSSLAGGTGTTNTITKWTNNQVIGNSSMTDDGSTITIADTVDFITQGNNTFGNTSADASTFLGNVTLNENLILTKGLSIPSLADPYGASGQVLTSGGGVDVANTWTTPTIGTYTDVNAGDGLLASGSGTSADPRIISPNYTGTANIILSATSEAAAIGAADSIIYVDQSLAAKTVKYGQVQSLPFNNYSWIIEADSGTGSPYTIASGETIDFVGVGNVSTAWDNATKELRISASTDPGTGIQFTLPVWDTTTSLGDSMVKQDAATGTILTISGLEPSVVIDDTTTGKGSLTISRAADATTYMSSGTASAGNYGTHVFSQTEGSTPRSVITLNADRTTTFSDNIIIATESGQPVSRISTATADGSDNKGLTISGAGGTSVGRGAYIVLWGNESNNGDAKITTGNTANAELLLISEAASGSAVRIQTAGSDTLVLDHSKNATFAANVTTIGDITLGDDLNFTTNGFADISNTGTGSMRFKPTSQTLALTLTGANATFAGNVEIDGDLTVDGIIKHGPGGSGGGTAKGGIFSKLYTTGAIGASGIAFTITRNSDAAMVFDVMFTGGGVSSATSTCKKYTIAKKYGITSASVYYNKIIDTGPASGGSGTADYDILFDVSGSSGDAIECNITAVGVATQQIGITINLGLGNSDAVVVMN